MFVAIVSLDSLSIDDIYISDNPKQIEYGGPWGDPLQYVHIAIPPPLTPGNIKAIKLDEKVTLVEDEQKTNQLIQKQWEDLRMERDKRLSKTDWTQLADVSLSVEMKERYRTYRQRLRDLPSTTTDPLNPEWPVL